MRIEMRADTNVAKLEELEGHDDDMTVWETDFVDSLCGKSHDAINRCLTTVQQEKLDEIYARYCI